MKEEINDLQEFKKNIRYFINKYNVKNIYIEIEKIESEVYQAGEENNSYKDVTINIEY